MVSNTRSVELEIRAQDLTGKTIQEVRKSIKGLKDDLDSQAKAAGKGKADFKKYADGLKELANEANKLSNLSAIVAKLEKLGNTLNEQNAKVANAQKQYANLANQIEKLGVPTKKQAAELTKLQIAQDKAATMAAKAAQAYERQRLEAEAYGINTRNVKQAQEALEKTYQRTLQKLIDMRNAQAGLQKQQERAIQIAQAQARAERARLDKNNEALRKNLTLWQQQRAAIEAAKKAAADKTAQRAAEAHRLEQLRLKYTIERNVRAMREQRKAAEAARKAAAKAQAQRANNYANQQAAAQRAAAKAAEEAAREAARIQKEQRAQILANLEAFRRQQEAIKKARQEAQRAAHERRVAAAQAAAEAQRAIQLANQQAAAEAARQRAIQASLQAQRNQINAQRLSIRQQMAAAQASYNSQQNDATNRITSTLNPNKSLDGAMGKITTAVRNAQKAYRDQHATVESLTAATQRLKAAQEQMLAVARNIDAFRKQQAEVSRLKAEYNAVRSEYSRLNNAMRGGSTPEQIARLNQLQIKLNDVGAAYARQRVQMQAQETALKRAGVDVNNLAAAENRLAQNAARSTNAINGLSQRLGDVARNSRRGADELRRFANSTRTALGFVQRLKGQLLALTATYVGLNGAIDIFNKTIQAGKDGAVVKIRAEVLADGWEGATAQGLEQYFRGTAERMGLELKGVIQDASKLFVAAKENGYRVQEAQFVYEQFSGLGQLMGADAETQKGITKALSDMFSKGTIQAEELKGQLGDRLPQAMALFAKATGKTSAELMDMMKDGKLTADYILDAALVIDKTYGEQMAKMFDTVTANQNRVNNAFQDWLRIMADAGVMDNFKNLLKELASWFRSEEGKQWALNIAAAMNKVIDALRWCIKHVNQLTIALGALVALGFAQVLAMIVVSLNFMTKNLALVGAVVARTAARLGLLSTQAQALFRLASMQFARGNFFTALLLVAKSLLSVFAALFKRFIVFELIIAVVKGIIKGFEDATGQTLKFSDALAAIGDVFAVVGDIITGVFRLIETVTAAITLAIGAIVEMVVYIFKDITGQSTDAAEESGKAWFKSFADSEGKAISFARKVARVFDQLKMAAKAVAIYIGGWIDWALAKLDGRTVATPEWQQIAHDVAEEVKANGAEANQIKRERRRQQGEQLNKAYEAPKTETPEERQRKQSAEDAEKAAQARAKADEKIEKARQKAEDARKRAEEAALKRLEKQMSFEKILEKRIKIWKGLEQETIGAGQSITQWYMGQYATLRTQYAAPTDKYADYKSGSDEAADKQVEAANKQVEAAKKQTDAANKTDKQAKVTFQDPVKANYRLTSPYGMRIHPIKKVRKMHTGIDQAAPIGTDIHASAKGVVKSVTGTANDRKGYGLMVTIKHDNGYETRYAHLSKALVKVGQAVEKGQHIAEMGSSGGSTGSHLHFEVLKNGKRLDPAFALKRGGSYSASAGGYETTRGTGALASQGTVKANTDKAVLDYYKQQEAYWKNRNVDGKSQHLDEQRHEQAIEFIKELREKSREAISEFYKTAGVNGIEGLIARNPATLTLDLSSATLDEIVNGFRTTQQPEIDKRMEELLQILILDYKESKGVGIEEAKRWGKTLEPQLKRYASLQVQKGMQEQVDAFVAAINEQHTKWDNERSDQMEELASRVARGETGGVDAFKEVVEINNKFISSMNMLIDKMDGVISSPSYATLAPEQQIGIRKARESVIAKRQNPSEQGGRQAADATIDAMNARLEEVMQEQINFEKMLDAQVQAGMITMAEHHQRLGNYLQSNKDKMNGLIQSAYELSTAMGGVANPEKMAQLAANINQVGQAAGKSQIQVAAMAEANEQLVEGMMSALDSVADGIAGVITGQMTMKEALAQTAQAIAKWAADAVMEIAKVIAKQIILNAISSAFGGGRGAAAASAGSAAAASVRHTGGLAEQGIKRKINPFVFVGATRYHTGGIAGLAPNEVPAILQRGEEVLTKQDPRHRNNAYNGGGNQAQSITLINSYDPVDVLTKALASSDGQKVLVKAIGKHRTELKQITR